MAYPNLYIKLIFFSNQVDWLVSHLINQQINLKSIQTHLNSLSLLICIETFSQSKFSPPPIC